MKFLVGTGAKSMYVKNAKNLAGDSQSNEL
jgi:hypothetical protein